MSLSIQSTKNSRNSDMSDISVVALSVTGNVTGDLIGNVTGDLTGNVTGDLTGDVTGNLTGDVTGNLTGDVTGNNLTLQATGSNTTEYELLNINDQNNNTRFTLYSWVTKGISIGSYLRFASPNSGTSIDMFDSGPVYSTGQIQLNSTDSTAVNNSFLRLNSGGNGSSSLDGFVHLKAADVIGANGDPGSILIEAGTKTVNGTFYKAGEIKLIAGSCDFGSGLQKPGGKITLETQKGTQNGGNGGDVEVLLGEGNIRGRGGDFRVLGRNGGVDSISTTDPAGNGSSIYLITGNGGIASGSTNTGGNGGDVIVTLGQKGTGVNADGNDGEFKVNNSTDTILNVTTNITRVTNSFSGDSYKFSSFTINLSNIDGSTTPFLANNVMISIGQLDTLLSNNVSSVTGGNRICVKNIIINMTASSGSTIDTEIHISSDTLNQYDTIKNSVKLVDYQIATQNVTFYDNINKIGLQTQDKLYLVAISNVASNLSNVDVNISIEYIVL